ncbi:hypothetical protein [Streptomyces sp. NPDC001970]
MRGALLEAGAVLPLTGAATAAGVAATPPATGASDSRDADAPAGGASPGDVLTARAYGHPVLEGRTVVRLVPEAIGPAEDLSLEYLGFGAAAEPEPVGHVKRQSLGFPAWALVHDPENGHHALAVVKEMERLARLVGTKPGLAKEGFDEIGERLDRSVPHFLPTFYEQVARLFLAVESRQHASVFFGKARAAEQRHALAVDEERLREVFLEFAGAGALSGKALREYAKALAARLTPAEAYAQFGAVSRERCAAGLAPYAGMMEDLRRLAKAAKLDAPAEERALLADVIHTGAITRAAGSFWKSALSSLATLAAGDEAVRKRLLALLPVTGAERPGEFEAEWLALLDRCGAFELLLDGTVPAAEWLSAWAGHRRRSWRGSTRIAAEPALLERLADRLIADGTPVRLLGRRGWATVVDFDLLDTCLALGVPVEDPTDEMETFELGAWLSDEGEGRRDLAAVCADPRFSSLLRAAVERLAGEGDATEKLRRVVELPALRTVLAGWIADRADDLERPFGLPELDSQLKRLSRFSSPSVLAAAPEAVDRIVSVSPAPALARTLRAGIFDELGWPALEEALPGLGKPNPQASTQRYGYLSDEWYQQAGAWPALLVRLRLRVAAVGPDSILDQRTLTLPSPSTRYWDQPTIRYVGGQWLIANGHGDDRRAIWSGRPNEPFKPSGDLRDYWTAYRATSLELPDGSRCFGGRPVHAGDTAFAEERRSVASDGISLWVLHEGEWWEYDPESARRGRVSLPAFFDSALAEGGGVRLLASACRLLPVQPGLESSPFGTKDGLLGWWVRYDEKERTLTACSVDGSRSLAVPLPRNARIDFPDEIPLPPLRLPAGAALHPRELRSHTAGVALYDAEGVCLARLEDGDRGVPYAAGTPFVTNVAYWHALRPRDEQGSAVLRAVTDADAEALLAAVAEGAKPEEAVRRLLPGIGHPGLMAGVAGLVEEAARHVKRLRVLAERAAKGRGPAASELRERKVPDGLLRAALGGLAGSRHYYGYYPAQRDESTAVDQLRALARALAPGAAADKAELSGTSVAWLTFPGAGMAALALRAAAPDTAEEQRTALLDFLDEVLAVRTEDGDVVLADPRGRLRTVELRTARKNSAPPHHNLQLMGEVRHSGARRLVIVSCQRADDQFAFWNGIEYDPAGAFGAWDEFTLTGAETLGAPQDPARAASIARLVELVRERGPLPYRPEQAQQFAESVGITPVTAAWLMLGLTGIDGYGREGLPSTERLEPLGASSTEAQAARGTFQEFRPAERQAFCGLLVPQDPDRVAELWTKGFDLAPLTDAWIAARGKRRVAPAALIKRAVTEVGPGRILDAVLNPEQQRELTGRTEQRPGDDNQGLYAVEPLDLLTGSTLQAYVSMLRWLAYRLPFGDPLRRILPVTLRTLKERLADPALLLDLGVGSDTEGNATSARLREAFGLPAGVGGGKDGLVEVSETLVLAPMPYRSEWESVWVRPATLLAEAAGTGGGPGGQALDLLAAIAGETLPLRALRTLLSEEFAALVGADGPAGAQQDPLLSVPELVAEAAGRFGLTEDAAALHLMLLALPDPTDRNVAEWTGWKPARLKKARAELAATDLVVEAKRARAGRTLYLPGGWVEQKTPRLPAESWKTALLPWDLRGFVVPDRPVAELYAAAWQRVVSGDAPGFEEFRGRGGRGGRR